LTGGGTAGHCTPCLALLPHLEKHFDRIAYVGSVSGIERELVQKTGLEYHAITTAKLKRCISADNLTVPFRLIKGISEAKRLLKKLRPDAVFSKGGYVALPVAIAAGKLKIPLVLHESDYTLGLANKISSRYAREVLTSFKETADTLKNGVWTGSPVSPNLFGSTRSESRAHYGIKGAKPVLLVMGGSTGSTAINREIRRILPELTRQFSVLHITGRGNADAALSTTPDYYQVEFEGNMKYAYAAADVAVSRAGSNCLFELLAMKIPALLIPLPKDRSRGDQILNAKYFTAKGAFRTLYQENVTPDALLSAIRSVYDNRLNIALAQQKHGGIKNDVIADRIIRASLS